MLLISSFAQNNYVRLLLDVKDSSYLNKAHRKNMTNYMFDIP